MTDHQRLHRWMLWHALILGGSGVLSWQLGQPALLEGGATLGFAGLTVVGARIFGDFSFLFQPANLISLARLLGVLALLGLSPHAESFQLGLLALVIVLADGLDGYIARRMQTSSSFGAYLDSETDAFFVLAVCMLLVLKGLAGAWLLAVGFLRYGVVLFGWWFRPSGMPEKRYAAARWVAGGLMLSLAGAFLLPRVVYQPLLILFAVAVAGTFSYDLIHLFLHRKTWQESHS